MLHRWIIPIVLFVAFMAVFPLTAFSQKTLKLDLQKKIELENRQIPFKSSANRVQKLVHRIEVETLDGSETISFYYNSNNDIKQINVIEISNYNKSRYEQSCVYSYSDFSMSCIRTINTYDIKFEELQGTQIDGADCLLNEQGYIVQVDDSEDDYKSTYSYEYENDYVQSYSYNKKKIRSYTWGDGNVTMGGDSSDEYYTYSDITSPTNIYLPQLFMQTYGEDAYYFALIGRLGKNSKNLLSQYLRYNKKRSIEYKFNEEGDVIQMKDLYSNNVYNIYYDDVLDPNPTPGNPTTEDELGGAIDDAPEGSEDSPTEIFIPSGGITISKPLDINKHIRLKGGMLTRGSNNPYAMLRIRSGYSLELDNITIDGKDVSQKDGSLIVYGKLKLKEGVAIKNCKRMEADAPSGAICIAKGGQLTMNGGEITGNTGAYGSAVYNEGTFTLTGGEISFNNGQIGAVVNNVGGRFVMTGGKISSNKVTDGCGGVFVSDNSFFSMAGGEISNNEDCALYSWSDLQIGGQAKVSGLTLLNEGNCLLVNLALRNNWQISFVDMPVVGTVVASGYNGYQLTDADYRKIIYANDLCQLKLSGNRIVTYQNETGLNEINESNFRLSISGNRVQVEGLPSYTSFTIYGIAGNTISSHTTDGNGQCSFLLGNGIYLLNSKDQTKKFMVQ